MTARLLTVNEAAERLACSGRHVRRLVADQRIAAVRVGALIRISEQAIDEFIAASTTPATGAAPVPDARSSRRRARDRRHLHVAAGES